MTRISKTQLARQLRANVELLQMGGVNELPIRRAGKLAAVKPSPKSQVKVVAPASPAARTASQPAPASRAPAAKSYAPVIVPSAALEELKGFNSAQARAMETVAEQVRTCGACKLCATRTQTVFGTGDPRSSLMIVGEAPGGDEDARGFPFVGRAGKLLTDIIEKGMKYKREHVYICNVLKCRPPGNRNPEPEEIEACRGYLARQIEIVNPKVILAVGLFPAQWLTGRKEAIGKLRGQVFDIDGRKVIATYHPAYLLRNYTVEARQKVHQDVLLAVGILGPDLLVK